MRNHEIVNAPLQLKNHQGCVIPAQPQCTQGQGFFDQRHQPIENSNSNSDHYEHDLKKIGKDNA